MALPPKARTAAINQLKGLLVTAPAHSAKPGTWTSSREVTPGYAAVVDGSGLLVACCSHSMGGR
jgi:hypothetical protein